MNPGHFEVTVYKGDSPQEYIAASILRVKLARAKLFRSLYFNVCHCAAYPWAHHRKIGRCGK